jgi:uncharacterized protein with von Willebrand factor type A (vWA) domain
MSLIARHTELSANVVAFCRFLRAKGFPLGPGEEADALSALAAVPAVDDPETFRLALRAVLPRGRAQQREFDEWYAIYWRELEKALDSKTAQGPPERRPGGARQEAPSFEALKSWLHGGRQEEEKEMAAYSPGASTSRKDFSAFPEDELWELTQLIRQIARSLALRLRRRREKSKLPAGLDLRRTLRRNLRRGGEILELAWRKPRRERRQLALLCDVSKSMELYSRFLVQFLHAFQQSYHRMETFVFSSELYRVTSQLRDEDFSAALAALAEAAPGWSGGTRIGASLQTFVEHHGRRLLNKQCVVIVLSDGWDTGESELLSEAMRRIHRRAAKVIWLNPLAGRPGYQPTTLGMKTAMPFIDVFAAAHNAESLRGVARHLSG